MGTTGAGEAAVGATSWRPLLAAPPQQPTWCDLSTRFSSRQPPALHMIAKRAGLRMRACPSSQVRCSAFLSSSASCRWAEV